MRVSVEKYAETHIGPITFTQFCDIHNLNVVIKERKPDVWEKAPRLRYYANFDALVEIRDRNILRGVSGDGETTLEAIRNLADSTCGKPLVLSVNARRKNLDVPKFWAEEDFSEIFPHLFK